MSNNKYLNVLKHIADECVYIQKTIHKEGITIETFLEDETLKRAVVRSLEIIGEATKKIPVDIKLKWNSIQWKHMAGMRDRLIHDYMGINYKIVWDVAKNIIPDVMYISKSMK
jgi:uncharacterized protein with HEPN domain